MVDSATTAGILSSMSLELVISCAGFLLGSGSIIWLFKAGTWKGGTDAALYGLRRDLDKTQETMVGKVKTEIGHASVQVGADLGQVLAQTAAQIRLEFDGKVQRLHERLDSKNTERQADMVGQAKTTSKIDLLLDGVKAQRAEWDALRNDIRTLLQGEAATTTEISNFKERLFIFEQRMTAASEKIAKLESDVKHTAERRGK